MLVDVAYFIVDSHAGHSPGEVLGVIKLRFDDHSAGFVDVSVFTGCFDSSESIMERMRRLERLLESDLPWLGFWLIYLRGALAEVRIEHGQGETNEYNCLPHSHRLDITKPTDSRNAVASGQSRA
jgi:hypothetical protein